MGDRRWLRRAGRATLADGRVLLWSVAEGRRGRRWRASTRDGEGVLIDDLLLEVNADGRLGRVELATAAGQLTFHPEPDEQSAHGNIVGPAGIRHVALCWAHGRGLEIQGSPIADAVLVRTAAAPGLLGVATVGPDLLPRRGTVMIERVGDGLWLIDGRTVTVDADGLPDLGPDAVSWPLEDPGVRPQ